MMNFFKRIVEWLVGKPKETGEDVSLRTPSLPPVRFKRVTTIPKTPSDSEVEEDKFYAVVHKGKLFWTVLRCPCGCGEVISLPMSEPHNPRWILQQSENARPNLRPSVWRNQGCMSHFWIKDGRVHMCGNTGTAPWIANPKVYSKPTR
jgi:hypothetical protein